LSSRKGRLLPWPWQQFILPLRLLAGKRSHFGQIRLIGSQADYFSRPLPSASQNLDGIRPQLREEIKM
jgi:hypothetical protein